MGCLRGPLWSYLLFKYTQQHTACFTENSASQGRPWLWVFVFFTAFVLEIAVPEMGPSLVTDDWLLSDTLHSSPVGQLTEKFLIVVNYTWVIWDNFYLYQRTNQITNTVFEKKWSSLQIEVNQ